MKQLRSDKFIPVDIPAIVCIAVAIFCIAVVFTLNFRPLYYMEMERQNLSAKSGFSDGEIKENYRELIRWNSFTVSGPLKLPTIPISDDAIIHFDETKRIFAAIQIAGIITVIFSVLFIILRRRNSYRMLIGGSITALSFIAIVGTIYLIAGWEKFFIAFHDLMFGNELWIFDIDTDPIIHILPESFFMKCVLLIIGIMVFLSIALLVKGYFLRKKLTT